MKIELELGSSLLVLFGIFLDMLVPGGL